MPAVQVNPYNGAKQGCGGSITRDIADAKIAQDRESCALSKTCRAIKLRDESVADAFHGFDFLTASAELFADLEDVYIDRTLDDIRTFSPDAID